MRSFTSPLFVGLVLGCSLFAGLGSCLADDSSTTPERQVAESGKKQKQKQKQSTLSSLGIDFGAAELERFTELGLSEEQKEEALKVVRDRKPTIDKLCVRMANALRMDEATGEAKLAKQIELAAIVEEFKLMQSKIMTGLHAVVTPEQMKRLEAIKRREQQAEARSSTATG